MSASASAAAPAASSVAAAQRIGFDDDVAFPPFSRLSEEADPSTLYYTGWSSGPLRPRRHWCFLGDIDANISFFGRATVTLRDRDGERFNLGFYLDEDDKPSPVFKPDAAHLRAGWTLAVLYAERKTFMDMTDGVRQENVLSCYVFKARRQQVHAYGQHLLRMMDKRATGEAAACVCFQCGKPGTEAQPLQRCGSCRLAEYCGRDCQRAHWKEGQHKALCADSQQLLRLACLPRHRFVSTGRGFGSKFGWFDMTTLPPYVHGPRAPAPSDDSDDDDDDDGCGDEEEGEGDEEGKGEGAVGK